jgi:20S proteasome subunit beta 2
MEITAASVPSATPSGFSFDNVHRNAMIEAAAKESDTVLPMAKKTGTTICGLVYKVGK